MKEGPGGSGGPTSEVRGEIQRRKKTEVVRVLGRGLGA